MNDNTTSKAGLWADRVLTFQESGLSRKEWCMQNQIPQSTLSYWIRKLQSEATKTACAFDPRFEAIADVSIYAFTSLLNPRTENRNVIM